MIATAQGIFRRDFEPVRMELVFAEGRAMEVGPHDPLEKTWVLFGSAVLLLHGLRREIGDVDVFVRYSAWRELDRSVWAYNRPDQNDPPFLERECAGHKVHAFHTWTDKDPEVDARQCRRAAEAVAGWWCTPLGLLRMHKAMSVAKHPADARQAKHLPDIEAIDAYLGSAA